MFILQVNPSATSVSAPRTVSDAIAEDGSAISNIAVALTNPNLTDRQRQDLTNRLKELEQKLARDQALQQPSYLAGKSSIDSLKVQVT